jgi:hypothetical protein
MLAIVRSPPLRVRRVFQYHLRGEPYSLVRDRVSTQRSLGLLKLHDSQTAPFSGPGRYFVTSRLIATGGDNHVYSSSEAHNVPLVATENAGHACISAWVARCDDSPGAAVRSLEVSPVSVFPKRGKCVGLAGFCVNALLSRQCMPVDLWSRAYRQDMPPGGQHRIVTLINPKIRNVDTVDEQVEELESSKISWPADNQTSVIVRTRRGRVRSGLLRLNGCACSKAARDCNHD